MGSALAVTGLSSAQLPQSLLLGVEAAGFTLLVAALVLARADWVVPAVAVVIVPEAVTVAIGGPAQLAPVLGTLLLAAAELAFWSIERSSPAQEASGVGLVRLLWLLGVGLAGCAVGLLMATLSELPLAGGFDLTALGMAAAITVGCALLWLSREAVRG